ncbi:SPRY domain containing protein, putative [Trypanosoma equiperdum]|uniref:SPRY domain containing protein, putative n=1 Tax=Trypanosoma equiperdum TaxID=5694 RepID=A0A1G4I736_TRYEQ|nr:SPRY domain containing protein, putative [Trypanosoma equiperdum]
MGSLPCDTNFGGKDPLPLKMGGRRASGAASMPLTAERPESSGQGFGQSHQMRAKFARSRHSNSIINRNCKKEGKQKTCYCKLTPFSRSANGSSRRAGFLPVKCGDNEVSLDARNKAPESRYISKVRAIRQDFTAVHDFSLGRCRGDVRAIKITEDVISPLSEFPMKDERRGAAMEVDRSQGCDDEGLKLLDAEPLPIEPRLALLNTVVAEVTVTPPPRCPSVGLDVKGLSQSTRRADSQSLKLGTASLNDGVPLPETGTVSQLISQENALRFDTEDDQDSARRELVDTVQLLLDEAVFGGAEPRSAHEAFVVVAGGPLKGSALKVCESGRKDSECSDDSVSFHMYLCDDGEVPPVTGAGESQGETEWYHRGTSSRPAEYQSARDTQYTLSLSESIEYPAPNESDKGDVNASCDTYLITPNLDDIHTRERFPSSLYQEILTSLGVCSDGLCNPLPSTVVSLQERGMCAPQFRGSYPERHRKVVTSAERGGESKPREPVMRGTVKAETGVRLVHSDVLKKSYDAHGLTVQQGSCEFEPLDPSIDSEISCKEQKPINPIRGSFSAEFSGHLGCLSTDCQWAAPQAELRDLFPCTDLPPSLHVASGAETNLSRVPVRKFGLPVNTLTDEDDNMVGCAQVDQSVEQSSDGGLSVTNSVSYHGSREAPFELSSPQSPEFELNSSLLKPVHYWDTVRSGNVVVSNRGNICLGDASRARELINAETRRRGTRPPVVTIPMFALGAVGVTEGKLLFNVRVGASRSLTNASDKTFAVGVTTKYFGLRRALAPAYLFRSNGTIAASVNDASGVPYGCSYASGSQITVCLDFNCKELSFSLNGRSLGTAFRFLDVEDPEPLFPLVIFGEEGDTATIA